MRKRGIIWISLFLVVFSVLPAEAQMQQAPNWRGFYEDFGRDSSRATEGTASISRSDVVDEEENATLGQAKRAIREKLIDKNYRVVGSASQANFVVEVVVSSFDNEGKMCWTTRGSGWYSYRYSCIIAEFVVDVTFRGNADGDFYESKHGDDKEVRKAAEEAGGRLHNEDYWKDVPNKVDKDGKVAVFIE